MPSDEPDPAESYVAATALYYTSAPGSGVVPTLAYRPGETVPGRILARNPAWREKVRARIAGKKPEARPARRGKGENR